MWHAYSQGLPCTVHVTGMGFFFFLTPPVGNPERNGVSCRGSKIQPVWLKYYSFTRLRHKSQDYIRILMQTENRQKKGNCQQGHTHTHTFTDTLNTLVPIWQRLQRDLSFLVAADIRDLVRLCRWSSWRWVLGQELMSLCYLSTGLSGGRDWKPASILIHTGCSRLWRLPHQADVVLKETMGLNWEVSSQSSNVGKSFVHYFLMNLKKKKVLAKCESSLLQNKFQQRWLETDWKPRPLQTTSVSLF